MDKKVTGIVAYLTVIGWIISYVAGDKEGAKVHLNQGLVLAIASIIGAICGKIILIGWIVAWAINVVVFVFAVWGIYNAAMDIDKPLPIIGDIKLLK